MTKLTKIVVSVVIFSSSMYAVSPPKLGMTEKQYGEIPIRMSEEQGIKTCEYEEGYAVLYKDGICIACGLIDVDKYEATVSDYNKETQGLFGKGFDDFISYSFSSILSGMVGDLVYMIMENIDILLILSWPIVGFLSCLICFILDVCLMKTRYDKEEIVGCFLTYTALGFLSLIFAVPYLCLQCIIWIHDKYFTPDEG